MKSKISYLITSFFNWYIKAMSSFLYPKNCCDNNCYDKKPTKYYTTHK
jgi:hypothetical protein